MLALDKQGNLVVIENKLDDSGRDVTWQVLKYASYCSTLNKFQIIKIYQEYLDKKGYEDKAEQKISDFFDNKDLEEISLNNGLTQRLILVAGNFRKEVTSTVLWLLNYNLRIQCFKVVPYSLDNQLLLDIEQIIPMKDAEDFSISMATKTQEDISSQEEVKTRHILRKEFWTKLLKRINESSNLFQNISPSIYHWIGASSGIRGIGYNFAVSKAYGRCELYIDRGDKAENEQIFDILYAQKDKIENEFGKPLEWERLEEKRASRIKYEDPQFNVFDKNDWDKMINFMSLGMINFEKSLRNPLKEVSKKVKEAN